MKKILEQLFLKKSQDEEQERREEFSESVKREFEQLKQMGLSIPVFAK